jgi:hypothetical protein
VQCREQIEGSREKNGISGIENVQALERMNKWWMELTAQMQEEQIAV